MPTNMNSKTCSAEIVSRFAPAKSAAGLVYAPIGEGVEYRETRVYDLAFEGDSEAVQKFVREVLSDEHAQDAHFSDGTDRRPAIDGATYFVDVSMKRNVLDLEKEYLLKYYRSLQDPGFTLEDLVIKRRIYIFGDAAVLPASQLERDLVNPVIQESVTG